MTSRISLSNSLVRAASVALVSAALLAGCEKKKPPPAPPPPPPPPPSIPDKIEVQALLQELDSDARVHFPQDNAPTERSLGEGVIRLANAIVKGDSGAMRGMLDRSGQAVLDELVGNGGWDDATKKIEAIRVVRLRQEGYDHPPAVVATAIQDPDGAYVLVWRAEPSGDSYLFSPQLAADGVKARASEWDDADVTGAPAMDTPPEAPADTPAETPARDTRPAPQSPGRGNTPGGGSPGGG